MSWTCPASGKTFELELCENTGRRVFKQPRERADANWDTGTGKSSREQTALTFAKCRKQMTLAKAKARNVEAKVKRKEELEEATRATHAGTIHSLFSRA